MLDINSLSELFNTYLKSQSLKAKPNELYEPVNYIMALGGKRIRPLMVQIASALYRQQPTAALPVAYAVELFHNFTLVHDDIMDEAALRRGQPTVQHKFGNNAAILSGDVMMLLVYRVFESLPKEQFFEILPVFNKAAIEVCEGQQYDMNFETQTSVTLDEYLKMIEYKTAVLLAASLQLGGIVAGVNKAEQEKLYQLGINMGLAFQIQDDYLDSFGDPEKFGKTVGGDIRQNKKTFLLINALELASEAERNSLFELMQHTDAEHKVAEVKRLYVKLGIDTLAQKQQTAYFETCLQIIDSLQVNTENKEVLKSFSNNLFNRTH